MSRLHLVSWNVAGWRTALDEITRTTRQGPTAATKKVEEKQLCVAKWLERLDADIICLQETKLTSKQVEQDARALCASADGDKWSSFWACNDGKEGQRAGLNGVATFVRNKALSVVRASARPLGDKELDDEGRCVLTDHGTFVLFNAYVPNGSGGKRLAYKLRWLTALRRAMAAERQKGKHVLLAGDLNCAVSCKDRCFLHRGLDASSLKQAAQLVTDAKAKSMIAQAAEAWPAVRDALRNRTVVACSTANSRTGETFSKFRCRAIHTKTGDAVQLSPAETSESYASSSYEVDGVGVESDGEVVLGSTRGRFLVRGPNCLTGSCLREALTKLSGVALSAEHLKLAASTGALDPPQDAPTAFGAAPVSSQAWLRGLLRDGFVDSLDALHPQRTDRFTCWNQYTNRRYDNEGSRIDYVIVDEALWRSSSPVAGTLDTGRKGGSALDACTLDGRWQPAGFDGSGIRDGRAEDYTYHTSRPPHTGIIYTPPTWSDHVAVSLLLTRVPVSTEKAPKKAAGDAQPHARVARITSFFAARAPGAAPARRPTPPPPPPAKKSKKTIQEFFGAKK